MSNVFPVTDTNQRYIFDKPYHFNCISVETEIPPLPIADIHMTAHFPVSWLGTRTDHKKSDEVRLIYGHKHISHAMVTLANFEYHVWVFLILDLE